MKPKNTGLLMRLLNKVERQKIAACILAGGYGNRMNSSLPKVLHEILGAPMILYTEQLMKDLGLPTYYLLSIGADKIKKTLAGRKRSFFIQEKKPLGTGIALGYLLKKLPSNITTLLTLHGDSSAFFRQETIDKLIDQHISENATVTVLTQKVASISHTGKIIRDKKGLVTRSQELGDKTCKDCEINVGVFVFNRKWLDDQYLQSSKNNMPVHSIVDCIELAHKDKKKISIMELSDSGEKMHINTQEDLQKAQIIARQRIREGLLQIPQCHKEAE